MSLSHLTGVPKGQIVMSTDVTTSGGCRLHTHFSKQDIPRVPPVEHRWSGINTPSLVTRFSLPHPVRPVLFVSSYTVKPPWHTLGPVLMSFCVNTPGRGFRKRESEPRQHPQRVVDTLDRSTPNTRLPLVSLVLSLSDTQFPLRNYPLCLVVPHPLYTHFPLTTESLLHWGRREGRSIPSTNFPFDLHTATDRPGTVQTSVTFTCTESEEIEDPLTTLRRL